MPKKKKQDEEKVRLSIEMPRVVSPDNSPESIQKCSEMMGFLAKVCAFMIAQNKDPQACMDMVNHIGIENKEMQIAFNYGSYDVDHFRMLILTLSTGYEESMNGFRLSIVEPIDFERLEKEEGRLVT